MVGCTWVQRPIGDCKQKVSGDWIMWMLTRYLNKHYFITLNHHHHPPAHFFRFYFRHHPQKGPTKTVISGAKQPGNPCISGHLIGVPISPYLGVPSCGGKASPPLTSQAPSWDDLSSLTEFQWNLALRRDLRFHHWYQQMSGDQASGDWIIFGWFLRGRPGKRGLLHLDWDKSIVCLDWYHFLCCFRICSDVFWSECPTKSGF